MARVHRILDCDVCALEGSIVPAVYDAKTKRGPWAYLCEEHFASHGLGLGLGTGRAQRLVLVPARGEV